MADCLQELHQHQGQDLIPKDDIRRTIFIQAFSESLIHLFFRSVVLDEPSAWTAVFIQNYARAESPKGLRGIESYCQLSCLEILKQHDLPDQRVRLRSGSRIFLRELWTSVVRSIGKSDRIESG